MQISINLSKEAMFKIVGVVAAVVLFAAPAVFAVTTISTNIVTEGNTTLGDAVADSVTANAYFTQLRIGTGSTFDAIGAVGADELGVEGNAEIDGTLRIDGTVTAVAVTASGLITANGGVVEDYSTAVRADAFSAAGLNVIRAEATTANLATITGGVAGQIITLIFDDPVVVTDADTNTAAAINLVGTGNFTSADDDTLQLVSDGTSWYEISRSVNN